MAEEDYRIMSSVFDNTRIVGGAFLIIGFLEVIAAILAIIAGFEDPGEEIRMMIKNWTYYCVILGAGSLICAILYAVFAFLVFSGTMSQKIEILASYVKIVGIITALGGVFGAIASIVGGLDIGASLISAAILVVIGLIIVYIAGKINDGKQTTGDKIIWIILMIAFILKLIFEALGIVGSFDPLSLSGIVSGIAGVVIAVFMIAFLFDSDVKTQMNM